MRTEPTERERTISEWQSSGLSIAEFSRRRGIPAKRMYVWKRLATGPKTSTAPGTFARVQTGITVQLEVNGIKLTVPLESLRAVIRELEHAGN